jgi:hypothetical protein
LACVIGVGALGHAQTVTWTLQEDLSSKLATGTQFTAKDAAGKVYRGHLITHRARCLLRRGSMRLVFDEPIVPVTRDPEGVFRAGNKMRLLKLGGSLADAMLFRIFIAVKNGDISNELITQRNCFPIPKC